MDHFELEKLIHTISWGKIFFTYHGSDNNLIDFILVPPSLENLNMSNKIYEDSFKYALSMELLKENELLEEHKNIGILWSDRIEEEIEGIKNDIQKIKRQLINYCTQKIKLARLKQLLRNAEKSLIERIIKKHEIIKNSAEFYALTNKQRYLIGRITRNSNYDLFWNNPEDFDKETDIGLVNKLTLKFFDESIISNAIIRKIARSNFWRQIWCASKITGNIFEGSPVLWTFNQRELVYWSYIYDMVFEAYERPPSFIIEDDDLMDSWFMQQSEKVESRTSKDMISGNIKDSKKRGTDKQELFIMADREGAKDVYGLNDPQTRLRIQKTQEITKKLGKVEEQNLPDSKIQIRSKAMEMQRAHIKGKKSRGR